MTLPDTITDLELTFNDLTKYDESDATKDTRTHIVNPPGNLHIWIPGMSAQEIADIARATGQEVVALCGYTWVPKKNPDKYPVCESCVSIAGNIIQEMG